MRQEALAGTSEHIIHQILQSGRRAWLGPFNVCYNVPTVWLLGCATVWMHRPVFHKLLFCSCDNGHAQALSPPPRSGAGSLVIEVLMRFDSRHILLVFLVGNFNCLSEKTCCLLEHV